MFDIRFRGRDIYTGEWIFGNYCKAKLPDGSFEHFIVGIEKEGLTSKVDPKTVGQYIGLRDMNGTRAYEGDVSEDDKGRRWVIFRAPGGFGTCRTKEYNKECRLQFYEELGGLQNNGHFMQCHRIIGNVHDFPSLLGGEDVKL